MWRVLFLVTGSSTIRRGVPAAVKSARRAWVEATLLALTLAVPSVRCFASHLERGNVVVHGVPAERAAAIVRHAEEVRSRVFDELFGDRSPRPWSPRCEIYVHRTPAAFSTAVGGSADVAQGATSIEFSADTVSLRRIDVLAVDESPLPPALAHELVHVVLADRFVAGPPPRWADEGLAVLFDAGDRQEDHDRDFRSARRLGLAWSARDLVALDDYPEGAGRQRVFYGQSASLVRWLIARRDARTFVRFLEDTAEVGLAAALESHYGLRSTADLELAWKEVPPMQTFGLAGRSP